MQTSKLSTNRILFGFYIFLVPLFLLLISLEIYLRFNFHSFFKERDIQSFHPFLQSVPVKGDHEFHINSAGFRGREIQKEKSPGIYRIFIMGGSAAFGINVSYEKSLSAILEEKLQVRYPERKIEVINAAVPWYSTEHSLISYLFDVKDYQPDMIIMWHGINDLYRSFSPKRFAFGQYKSDYSHFYGPVSRMTFQHFKAEPIISIYLLSMVYLIRIFYRIISADKAAVYMMRPTDIKDFPSLNSFSRNLVSFINSTHADHVQLILGTQPVIYREDLTKQELDSLWVYFTMCETNGRFPNLKSMIYGMNQFNQTTKEIAAEHQIPLIDLEAKIPKTGEFMWDDCHYTKKGNLLVAQEIYDFLTKGNYLEKAA